MSILDALRVQKANQQSVSQLAALPQNEIIRLAQMGQIPADVVPVVISEKARMAKEMANLQAAMQGGGQQPTVIEQAMQTNAQAEQGMPPQVPPQQAPQMPPQAPQMPPGVAGLPTGQMFQGQNFAAGGIVAFNGEEDSFVQGPTGLNVLRSEMPRKQPESLAEYIEQYRAMTGGARRASPEEEAYAAALKKGAMSPEDAKQQQWMRLLQAGLGIMGGTSPYAFTNIGQGSQEALKGYAEDVQRQQAQRMAELRGAAETARGRRLEQMEDIKGGATLYGQERDRAQREQLAKESQLGSKFAQNYLAMKRAGGDQRDDATIMNEGYQEFFKQYGYAQQRVQSTAQTAEAERDLKRARELQDLRQQAVSSWNSLQLSNSREKRQYENMLKTDPVKAAEIREKWITDQIKLLDPSGRAAPATPANQPSAAQVKPDIRKFRDAPPESVVGAFVPGKGWEIKDKSGTLLGYGQEG
jgi:hypothetical protein